MAFVLGFNGSTYRNTGSWGSPGWDSIGNIRNVTLNLEKNESDVTTRGGNGWRQVLGVLKDGSVEFEMVWDTADTDFTAVKNAFFNDTLIDMAFMDGLIATTGSEGLRAEMSVTNFTRNEPLEEAMTVSVTVRPGFSANAPYWYVTP
jgi:hypothetical protein